MRVAFGNKFGFSLSSAVEEDEQQDKEGGGE